MRKKCPYCGNYFKSNPKLGDRQKTCGKKECQKIHQKKYKKEWWKANKTIYKSRYKETKNCPSRKATARSVYLKQDYVKKKHAEQMRWWRKKNKLKRGKSVMCTDCDIEITSKDKREIENSEFGLSVMCTDTDILIKRINKGQSSHKWNVMCTVLDRHSREEVIT